MVVADGDKLNEHLWKYKFVEAYRVKGLVGPSDKTIVINEQGFTAYVIGDPDEALIQIDKRIAIANLILNTIFGERLLGKRDDLVNSQIKEIRSERKKHGIDGYLIIEVIGEIEKYTPSVEREVEGLHIAFDAIDKDEIRSEFSNKIKNVITALSLISNNIVGIEKVTDGVILYKNESSIIFPFTPKGHPASLHISSPIVEGTIEKIMHLFNHLTNHSELDRVTELLVSSLKSRTDSLRAYLSAWTAVEIFINKTFPIFEEKFFAELKAGEHPETREKYLDRIRTVMKDKYTLVDKFSVVSLRLSPANTDKDIKSFIRIKKQRDKLTHGENITDSELEVENTQRLLTDYIQLYLSLVTKKDN